jgi:pimeloyl-ACP methyl ester carboxylesterase
MPSPIVIVHGWSDRARSFRKLAAFLRDELGRSVTTIDLADWVSLNDEITYRDLRHALQRAWQEHPKIRGRTDVHLVTHSTGALVVRDWMTTFYTPSTVPFRRHVMLAPANFGSQLAHKGRAWYGRAFKGWRSGFETGTHLLRGLELASPYTWELAERELFGRKRWYGTDRVLAVVLVGNSGYGGVAAVTDEVGGDGTVRVSTANLNAARLTLDYTADPARPRPTLKQVHGESQIAFGVSDGDNHSSIAFKTRRGRPRGPHTADWLLRALTTRPSGWAAFVEELEQATAALYQSRSREAYFRGYQNTVIRARDDLGNPVEEFLIEFSRGRRSRFVPDQFSALFQRDVITDVHNYKPECSHRSFYVDVDLLQRQLGQRTMYLELEALPKYRSGQAVGYGKLGKLALEGARVRQYFVRNRTLLIDLHVRRVVGPKALRLEPYRP